MKKLSLVLALILVLTCAVLAACGGDDTSSSAASSNKPTASSKVESSVASSSEVVSSEVESSEAASSEVASSEVASSEVESSEVVSSEVESSEVVSSEVESSEVVSSDVESSDVETSQPETDVPAGESTNVALGKAYPEKGYAAGGEWPANYTANLTDGVAASELTFDNQWFAFCTSEGDNGLNAPNGVGTVTIDLGAETSITKVRVNTLFGDNVEGSGVNSASKITAYVGDASGNFTALGDLTSNTTNGVAWAELNCAGKGQFVKIEVTLNGIFAFLNEVEVYN